MKKYSYKTKSELRIRNVNAAAVSKIDQLADKSGMSRNSYLKKYIETLAVLDDLKEQEEKYNYLLDTVVTVLRQQGQDISEIKALLNKED